jgi:hypothetical protein
MEFFKGGTMTKTKKYRGIWLDRKGTTWDYRRGKGTSQMGLRVVCHKWADTGLLEMKLVKGDGRTADFVVYEEHEFENGTDINADRLATYWLEECDLYKNLARGR